MKQYIKESYKIMDMKFRIIATLSGEKLRVTAEIM